MLTDPDSHSDGGFTMIELSIVMLIMAVIMVIAGSGLLSLSRTAAGNDVFVSEEQSGSNSMAQLSRDIRSSSSVAFPSSTSPAATQTELILNENTPSGAADTVSWLYVTTATPTMGCTASMVPCLVREDGTTVTGPLLAHVANPSSMPIFTYYDGKSGSDISYPNSQISNIDLCTTQVTVNLQVNSTFPNVPVYESRQQVAITDEINDLTAPGNGFC